MGPDQTASIGAVCPVSTVFASILNSSVMLGNYLQQTTSADVISRCIFFGALRVRFSIHSKMLCPSLYQDRALSRPPDKSVLLKMIFLFLNQIYVVGTSKNRLNELVPLSTQNTCLK